MNSRQGDFREKTFQRVVLKQAACEIFSAPTVLQRHKFETQE